LSVSNIESLIITDSVKYVIIQATDCYFGFDLQDDIERACIYALIHTNSSEAINGWMVSSIFPEWVGGYSNWLTYEKDFVKRQIPVSVTYSAAGGVDVNKAGNDQCDSDDSNSVLVRRRLVKSLRKIVHSSSEEEEFEPEKTDQRKVAKVNRKSDKVPASKVKGDHLNNEGQKENATKKDSEVLYKDSWSDESWEAHISNVNPTKTWDGLPVCCDWDDYGHCPFGLKPTKCQRGECKNYVHHICSITWASENQIEESGIAILCRKHHPGFQKWLNDMENQDRE